MREYRRGGEALVLRTRLREGPRITSLNASKRNAVVTAVSRLSGLMTTLVERKLRLDRDNACCECLFPANPTKHLAGHEPSERDSREKAD